jgi:hypothetical protein
LLGRFVSIRLLLAAHSEPKRSTNPVLIPFATETMRIRQHRSTAQSVRRPPISPASAA